MKSGFQIKWKGETTAWLVPACVLFMAHLLTLSQFGFFRDEFYYIACSNHLAFGYVDQPPLSIWLLKMIRIVFGDSIGAIRIVPALASGVWIALTGLITRELGGKKFAILLAAVAAMVTAGNLVLFHYYSMNFLDLLFWQVLILILIRLIKTDDPSWWIAFGITAGFGLLNKISILFLGFGLLAGLLLTSQRKQLKSPQLWTGLGLALFIFLTYILWNMFHDWALLEFMHNAKTYKMSQVSPAGFFLGQFLYNNPVNILIWLPGLLALFFSRNLKSYRLFGWLYLSIYLVFMIQSAKDYYLAAAYPVLFAAGAVFWGQQLKSSRLVIGLIRIGMVLFIVNSVYFMAPITLPVLSVDRTIQHIKNLGIPMNSGENHENGSLPQHFADMHGWEEMVKTFSDVYQTLSPREQSGCLIYVRNYGEAGAMDFLGRQYGLPPVSCSHNNYWIWGPPEWDGKTAIVYGWSHDVEENLRDLNARFQSVELAAVFTHPYAMPYQSNRPIFICRDANFSFKEIWDHEKHYD